MRRHLLLASLTGLVLVAAVLGALLLVLPGGPATAPTPAAAPAPAQDPHGAPLASLRTVAVLPRGAAPVAASGQGVRGVELVRLQAGKLPAKVVEGTVLTDENCAPDAAGVSHCTNDIRLASGATLSVVHDHAMATIACLSPGERVRVRAA